MEQDIFVKHVQDVVRLCDKYQAPRFSKFLERRNPHYLKSNKNKNQIKFLHSTRNLTIMKHYFQI